MLLRRFSFRATVMLRHFFFTLLLDAITRYFDVTRAMLIITLRQLRHAIVIIIVTMVAHAVRHVMSRFTCLRY